MLIAMIAFGLLGIGLLWTGRIALAISVFAAIAGYLLWANRWNRRQARKNFLIGAQFARDNPGAEFPYDALGPDPLAISAVNLGMMASAHPDPESIYDYDEVYAAAKSLHGMMSAFGKLR
jgi:hypothetical protein